jgi:hypothetical protein
MCAKNSIDKYHKIEIFVLENLIFCTYLYYVCREPTKTKKVENILCNCL